MQDLMTRDGLELVEDLVFKAGSRESISSLIHAHSHTLTLAL